MKRISCILSASVLALSMSLSQADEGTAIFNGKDLTGWEGNSELWSVEDGAITGKTKADPADATKSLLKHNTFLVWKAGTVGDFELTLKYRIVAGNSGIQYRSKELPAGDFGPIISGYQADFEAGTKYSGILYEERGRGILALRGEQVKVTTQEKDPADPKSKPFKIDVTGSTGVSDEIQAAIKSEDWNEYKIVAKGNHLEHFINGHKTVDVTDEDPTAAKEGMLALQIHTGPAMVVQFKDLILKTLK